jgi:hypothetical protein
LLKKISTILLKKQVFQIWHNLCSELTSMWTFKMYSRNINTKTTINKNKMTIFYRSTSFRFSFIFRYFKVFQLSQIFTCGMSDLLLLAVGSLVVFILREYILKVHILVSSEHKLCQIWNEFLFPHEHLGARPSHEYSCGERNPLYPIRSASFVSIVLYPMHVLFL